MIIRFVSPHHLPIMLSRTWSCIRCFFLSSDESDFYFTAYSLTDYLVRTLSEKPLLVCSQKKELAQLTAQLQNQTQ